MAVDLQAAGGNGPVLSVENVDVRFGGIHALKGVSLSVNTGEICGLIGPNGAGKTTLFNSITRLSAVTAGSIRLCGRGIETVPARQIIRLGIARTFQNLGIYGGMTVLENVMLGAHHVTGGSFLGAILRPGLTRRRESEIEQNCRAILDELDLSGVAEEAAGSLPYATQKRMEIARALASRPTILLLDEPAGGLTHSEVAEFGELVSRVRDHHGVTIVLIEHHMGLVMRLCDRIEVFHLGRNLASGTPAEVRANPAVIDAYLGRTRDNA
ncbi:ABC transporter ATP-binding protein [Sinorhizobium alkalisoli]|uniref:High-affinity branched-chain amino acid ABC transporter ATP-binding protein LivG n=1 Tax=Sinorhizobium alkalisoli TaxID=1752398 RepID=A0A1E3VHU4_9HYPH|nr:ABC transporter ATP-binding protein [Sinorhizobium alkalisoli]MCG5478655.1 ABC transporter ATP-binding protein [Sinorhizobium alkalisoli]ODR93114.1 high-affinity branched-chain amino acid ABC transporter ATP-binding protein LivG [Sinorhizobium alkalisoli]QFI70571.1 Branched-chain amino acid transport ATP-binding protein LivG [Sinorhizobium alkalisoli]